MMKFATLLAKEFKKLKFFPKILFNINDMNLCLLLVFAFSVKEDWKMLQTYLFPT